MKKLNNLAHIFSILIFLQNLSVRSQHTCIYLTYTGMSVHVGIPVKACCKTLNNANLKSQLKLNINRMRILIMICYFWIFAITYSLITSYIKQEFKDSLIEISYFFDIRNSIAVEFADTISSLKVKSLNIRSILHFHIQ